MQIFTPKDEDSFVVNFTEVFYESYLLYRYFISFSVFVYREEAGKGAGKILPLSHIRVNENLLFVF
jgi:hypothetical protein